MTNVGESFEDITLSSRVGKGTKVSFKIGSKEYVAIADADDVGLSGLIAEAYILGERKEMRNPSGEIVDDFVNLLDLKKVNITDAIAETKDTLSDES